MKAAVYYTNEDIRVEELPIPQAGAGEIVVRTSACGVCVADTMEWYNQPKAPIVLGHEAVGIVAEIGEGVEQIRPGTRVFVHHHVACMACDACRRGQYTLCKQFKATKYAPGGFAEYFKVSTAHVQMDTLKLPENMSFEAATLIEPLACAVHGVRRAGVKPGDRVAVIGAGTIGLMFIEIMRAYGVSDIAAYETIPWRREQAKERGATVRTAADASEEIEKLEKETGKAGFDRVLVIAKDVRAMELGMALTAKGGTLLLFATPAPEEYLKFYVSDAFFKQLTVVLSYSADHLDTREAMRLLQCGKVNAEKYITHRFGLDELPAAIAQTIGRGQCLKCIVTMEGDKHELHD